MSFRPAAAGSGEIDAPSASSGHAGPSAVWGATRFGLLGGRVEVAGRRSQLRAVAAIAAFLGAPLLLARLLGRAGRRRELHLVERAWARGLARHLRMHLDLAGLELIEPGRAYIVTPLHEGFADALALLHLPLDLRFVVRDELLGWPQIGPTLRDTGQLAIRPEDGPGGYHQVRRAAPAILAGGESLVMFPQGSVLGIEIDFRRGPFALALALNRPILPVALTGAHRVWEHPFAPTLRFGERVSLQVLPPVEPAAYATAGAEVLRAVVQRQVKARALSGALAAPRRYVSTRDGYWDGYTFAIDPAFSALRDEVERHRQGRAASGSGVLGGP